ncbi:mannitol dehydrogenase family protein [Herbivorax sp. ANBcel31]|uniref:mannitol dehydrogenase family protein n=1 Tax=Herbivorax sp. ANBcel31 TaxID=3069754 RepID=UPI0027B1A483|nr:mannitol dehydrogenase family protein [Herbivorax sp. ANBcel31]MDQ2084877.1 mannitol dehydrogenase family protein [Herbivorax sp. ANBcel31]
MKLSKSEIAEPRMWDKADIELPQFDLEKMIEATKENPTWVHFGSGNIFRGFIAALQQELLNSGKSKTGIIAAETFDYEIIDRIYEPYDNLNLLVLMEPDGSLKKKVIASVAESLVGDTSRKSHWGRLEDIFLKESLQMVSFTVTEKGYSLTDISGNYLPRVINDFESGPRAPEHLISKIAALSYKRYKNGKLPIAFVSMDNCSHNGDVLKKAILTVVRNWVDNEHVEKEFLEYLKDPEKVSFPWTMIDKITPRPSEKIKDDLNKIGFESTSILCTDKNTFIAPFVNAEVPQYLVVEDHFPNGRMPLELSGALFTDRKTVDMVEKMKVTTCLNPLHTALAVFGCLLDYRLIADEMKDKHLKKLIEKIGYKEGMPVVVNPEIIDPKDFIDEVINKRLKNPFIPDSPQRIATDTSQKVGIRFGETIKTYAYHSNLRAVDLEFIPLAIAGWLRYLLGVNDKGEKIKLSPDPMLNELQRYLDGIELGDVSFASDKLKPILSNEKLFGINLYNVGLAQKIDEYFREMIKGKNAVRDVLEKYVG